ncbi:MAG: ClpXP protease specificity-enhancing factor [Natronospirillum sp.]
MSDTPKPPKLSDQKPYLMRAIRDWIVDNGCTPYMVVQADLPGVQVPQAYIQEGKITLNIAEQSVQSLNMGNDDVLFSATFGGELQYIRVPIHAVAAVFARENGQGMAFEVTATRGPEPPEPSGSDPSDQASGSQKRPSLKVVK